MSENDQDGLQYELGKIKSDWETAKCVASGTYRRTIQPTDSDDAVRTVFFLKEKYDVICSHDKLKFVDTEKLLDHLKHKVFFAGNSPNSALTSCIEVQLALDIIATMRYDNEHEVVDIVKHFILDQYETVSGK
ncbi:hypothetical protein CYMTET_35642 [Cymbomonas tetramitiformis]|uniref:Uncharacterized protein n=1 Tax=Cymbomonas tetramitiformis TaxID=36881 RepID=A0AAE0KNZ5_9CHLO|nr:hypothetical protein CYMTET_35642 [Cymbomonas tetramitiformis]|eukprot:gene44-65_t